MKPIPLKLSWTLRLLVAVILLQTLFFKFTAAPESVYIFTKVGMEPWGRLGSGVAELISALLLLWPGTVALGALIGLGVISGALGAHLTVLGIEVQGDHGQLFIMACIVFVACAWLLWLHRASVPFVGARLARLGSKHDAA